MVQISFFFNPISPYSLMRIERKEGKQNGQIRLNRQGSPIIISQPFILFLLLILNFLSQIFLSLLGKRRVFHAVSSTPVLRLSFEKSADGAEIALVSQEICLFLALGPELDGIGEGVHRLAMAADKRPSEIYVLQSMLLRLEVGDLADVIAKRS